MTGFGKLADALQGSYAIERELGRGGMATVFLARDVKHDRPVALKVLHPELAAVLGAERFQREIRLAARLQHPHILTVHDSGEAAGQLWFTMPYVEGESLRDRLTREKQLPVEDAVRITQEAAQALEYAHQHGIIHRDIKPENLLLTRDGNTLVADFGIARAAGDSSARLTETGLSLGTAAYMSPEQAAGEREVDARSDIYSLGCVLYEMLAGELPFTGPTAQAIIAQRLTSSAPPVRRRRPSVSEALDAAVAKAMAPFPADRHSSAAAFRQALSAPATASAPAAAHTAPTAHTAAASTTSSAPIVRPPRRIPTAVAFVLGLLVTATMGMFVWSRTHRDDAAEAGVRRVAVLPFENLGPPEQEYFSDGMTDEVRGKLAALPGLQVTARSSASQYKKTEKTPRQIGDELGVEYLLTGTVRWVTSADGSSQVRVSPELIKVSTGSTEWQAPFNATLTDVFQVQADISARVAQALGLAIGAQEQEELAERPTQNLAAYDAYLKGEAAWDAGAATTSGIRQTIRMYEQAAALDSTFLQAWAQLSRAYSTLHFHRADPGDARQAELAARRALALGPNRPEALLAMGDFQNSVAGDPRAALASYAAGLRAAPNDARLLSATARALQTAGRWEESGEQYRHAEAVDPRSVTNTRRLALALLWLRRYPESMAASRRALALAPGNLQALSNVVMIHLAQGDLAAARAALAAAPAGVSPAELVSHVAQFWDLYWVLPETQQQLLLRLSPGAFDDDRGAWAICLAQVYALRGDSARARAHGDSAAQVLGSGLGDATPNDGYRRLLHGVALAYAGRHAEAIAEGERGLALQPISLDAYSGPYNQHLLMRIYLMAGEREKALELLEPLLRIPYYLSPGWLRVDPTFDPLRGNPRFEKLAGSAQ